MKQTYSINGMTCMGCVAAVSEKLTAVAGVDQVAVNLEKGEATLYMKQAVSLNTLKAALNGKYTLLEKRDSQEVVKGEEPSKLQQLRPLLLIFAYLFSAAFLLHYKQWDTEAAMLDFMGLFYVVFSFFKLLDLNGFPQSFRMYDPLAKAVPAYAWVYPFLELALGVLFLFRLQITLALIMTIVILGITTIGVARTLLDKKRIQCACLGTALKLPMTEATLIENSIMLTMALLLLGQSLF